MARIAEQATDRTARSEVDAPPRRPKLALVALCLAFFIVQVDATVVNVALQTIQRDLGGGLGDQQWVIAAYTVVLAAMMLTAGAMGDRIGARRVSVLGLVTFAVASVLCAVAPTVSVLIVARTIQGAGASALLPCSLSLIVQQFPDRRARAYALGVWGGVGSMGMATGPIVGGTLIALASWRAIFLVNVPFCAITIAMTYLFVTESPRQRNKKLDPLGVVSGTVALAAVTGGFIEAGQLGWGQPIPLTLLVGGLAVGALFLVVERRHREPMLPLRIFASRQFSAGTTAGGIFNFCLYGVLFTVSLFLQGPLGQSAVRTAMFILPVTIAIGIGAPVSARLTARFGARLPMLIGYCLGAVGAAVLTVAGPSGPLVLVVVGAVTLGFCSIAMPAMTSVVMSAVEGSRTSLASGVLNTARQAGGALGAAVLGTLLTVGVGRGEMLLRVPMLVVILGYAGAIVCTFLATATDKPGDGSTAAEASRT